MIQCYNEKMDNETMTQIKMNQLDILRKMTGEERLEQALELSELTRALSIVNIKQQLGKKASHKAIIRKLRERIEYGTERNPLHGF